MQAVNPVDSAVSAYGEVWEGRRVLFQIGAIPAAVMIVVALISLRAGSASLLGAVVTLLCQAVSAGLMGLVIMRWIRSAEDRFATLPAVLPARPAGGEQTFLIWYVGLSVLPSLVLLPVTGGPISPAVGGVLGLVLALVALYVQLRLSFFYIELALGRLPSAGDSFAATSGVVWRMLGATILVLIPVVVATLFAALIFGSGAASTGGLTLAVLAIVEAALSMVGVALVASVGLAYWRAR